MKHKLKWEMIRGIPGRRIYKLVDKRRHLVVGQVEKQPGGWGCWIKNIGNDFMVMLDPYIKVLVIDAKMYVKEEYVRRLGQGSDRSDSKMGEAEEGGETLPPVT